MESQGKPRVIALEEHYFDPILTRDWPRSGHMREKDIIDRLDTLGELRLQEMDEAGIDLQVLSQSAPSLQRLDAESAARVAPGVNDRLAEVVRAHPTRYAGFAALPTPDPKAAADELERCVVQHGFKGAMIHGQTNGQYHDHKKFWPIFERAAKLDVPIYLHPAAPSPAIMDATVKEYVKDYPGLLSAGFGFTFETSTQALRLVLSGLFDKYPTLKIILGHLGEGLPFLIWRINHSLSRPGNKKLDFRDVFSSHFYVTTSGFFSHPALLCCVMELGIDRILFSVDYPFIPNPPAVEWMKTVPLCAEDRDKMLHGNAERLLKMGGNR
jgi:2,3-dihydroxybenzoate decarboxylase